MTNTYLKAMSALNSRDDLNFLNDIYNDDSLPNQVRKRAHFKASMIWNEYNRRSVIAQKASATRAKNRLEKEIQKLKDDKWIKLHEG